MSPLCGEPRIVEVEPPDHRAEIESRLNWIELKGRARNSRAPFYGCTGYEGSQKPGAGGILQRFKGAAERVQQTPIRGLPRFRGRRLIAAHIIGNLFQNFF